MLLLLLVTVMVVLTKQQVRDANQRRRPAHELNK
jgi:hypothetical protein